MTKRAQVSWDNIDIILAVVDQGSVAGAARALGINHATVLRRIAEFERSTGTRLFEKSPRGYQLSADRRKIVEAMREATDALSVVQRMIEADRPRLSGGLRITTTDTFARFLLPGVVAAYAAETGIQIELLAENAHVDFDRMEAHLTVRPAPSLPPELDGLPVGAFQFGVFAAPDAKSDSYLGLSGPLSRTNAAEWVRSRGQDIQITADSFMTLAVLAAQGAGRAVLPTYVGEAWPGLQMVEALDIKPVPVWVAAHVDFARSGRINRARKHIAEALRAHPALVESQ